MKTIGRFAALLGLGMLVGAGAWATAPSAATPVALKIDAQSLEGGLNEFAKQTGLQVIFRSEEAVGFRAPQLEGSFAPEEALRKLLEDSGLTYQFVNARTVAISSGRGGEGRDSRTSDASGTDGTEVRLAQLESASAAEAANAGRSAGEKQDAGQDAQASGNVKLEEIVVTAQKQTQRLQDVPVPVTVINTAALADTNQTRIQDYYSKIPGLNLQAGPQGQTYLAIRGIATDPRTNPTVAVVIDDVPFGGSSQWGNGATIPDIDPGDLERIEVLRGPQGTLYGANSIGGLLKFVTVDPSTDKISGRLQAGTHGVSDGGLGHIFRGSANIPMSDSFAVRVSGFSGRDSGYVDNPVLGLDDVNEIDNVGGRLSAMWRPSETFSVKLGAQIQNSEGEGAPAVFLAPGFGDLQQDFIAGSGEFERELEAYSAIIRAKFGKADFTSISGYNVNTAREGRDASILYSGFMDSLFGVTGSVEELTFEVEKFMQEARLEIPLGKNVDWMGGLFFTREESGFLDTVYATNEISPESVGEFAFITTPTKFTERALFSNLTVRFSEAFDLQLGGRLSRNEQRFNQELAGLFVTDILQLPSPLVMPTTRSKESPFTYLVTPRLKLSDDTMVYARLASGYRAGGPNGGAGSLVHPSYESDETRNYEIGIKSDLIGSLLSVDASVYYVQWDDVQVYLCESFGCYSGNVGKAASRGIELSIQSRPWRGSRISAWVARGDAELTEDFPSATGGGLSGDRLPFSTEISGSFAIEQDVPLGQSANGVLGASIAYTGDRTGLFTSSATRANYPSYAKIDVHAGVEFASWRLNAFVNNATDKRGLLGGGLGTLYPQVFNIIQPRTIGLSISTTF